jgi:hypothetical protein
MFAKRLWRCNVGTTEKSLPKGSLQQIPYIGPAFETKFKNNKIYSIGGLIKHCSDLSASEIKFLVGKVCVKKGSSVIDQKAYNSVILFLYEKGNLKNLPSCKIVRE